MAQEEKELLQNLKERFGTKGNMGEGLDMPDVLDWFEKQGKKGTNGNEREIPISEKKPVDKVEPKFEIGDLITNGILVGKIDEIHELGYHAFFGDHYADVPDIENWHKWTIQDAKDGDVLVTNSNIIFIFKYLDEGGTIAFRVSCTENSGVYFPKIKERLCDQDAHPSTKGQRDLLFQKMKEAGYEWDAKQNKLKKIKQKPAIKIELDDNGESVLTPFEAELFSMMSEAWQCYSFGEEVNIAKIVKEHSIELLERANEQKPAWTEEDEKMYRGLHNLIYSTPYCDSRKELSDFLDSLKNRLQSNPSDLRTD